MNNNNSTEFSIKKHLLAKTSAATLLLILGIVLSLTGKAQINTVKQSNFYAITGNGLKDTSWLFGTYHLVKSSYLNEVPEVVNAFNKSKAVAVELVIDSAKLLMANAMGMLKDKTLSDLLDKPFKDSLDNEMKTTLGIGIAQINQLKPINVAITLSMVYLITDTNSLLQKYSGSMLDGYFAETGKQYGKNISAFETIEEQMDILFNKSTDEEQVTQLQYFLRNKTAMINQGNELITQWFKHDLDNMYSVSERGLNVFGNEDDFLNNRNNKWMKILPGLLAKESQFIAVGALHLAGPHGLVKQLQQLGYTVTAIKL
jgi:uncharacterized protein